MSAPVLRPTGGRFTGSARHCTTCTHHACAICSPNIRSLSPASRGWAARPRVGIGRIYGRNATGARRRGTWDYAVVPFRSRVRYGLTSFGYTIPHGFAGRQPGWRWRQYWGCSTFRVASAPLAMDSAAFCGYPTKGTGTHFGCGWRVRLGWRPIRVTVARHWRPSGHWSALDVRRPRW